ncbi:HD family phosphohydrolase [Tepidibacillus sp. LV47]|uniref:HD family phosphohydrolase n=1 Tax=Tepidibacillus sp. LV47 TaxID=3398228 RepID=UPI003AABE59A
MGKETKKTKLLNKNWRKQMEGWETHPSIRYIMYVFLGLMMYLLLMGQVIPKTYELKEGQISPVTLTSPIRALDQWATELKKKEAEKSVPEVYSKEDSILKDQINQMESMFDSILSIVKDTNLTSEQKKEQLKRIMVPIKEDSIKIVANLSETKVKNLRNLTRSALEFVMTDGDGINIKGLNEAYEKVDRYVQSNPYDNDAKIKNLAKEITKQFVKPNLFYNPDQTALLREEARSKVEPVYIKKDELIVKKGQFIDKPTYERLKAVGLLKDTSTKWPYLGLFLLVSLMILLLYFSIERMKPILHQNNSSLLMLIIIFLLTFTSIRFVDLISGESMSSTKGYLAPVAFGVMLITLLINMKLAILSGAIFSLFVGLVFNQDQTMIFDFRYGFVALIGSTAGAFALGRIRQRSGILKAGFIVALFNFLSIAVVIMLTSQSYTLREVLFTLLYGVLSGLFSAVLTIGLLPFFETFFGILSPIKLIELSNPNHPLLRKLLIKTPGTYHHSIIVGNLAEAAAEAIGADGLLARVGAYYHDVGKTKRPTFFIENQLNIANPHDRVAPHISKNIIIAHTKDGMEMLKEYKIPKAIQDIAMQHHGTSLLKYFYHKALQISDKPIPESEYRYSGPKPQTKEAAIVGIADSVEAAVRSIQNPTNEIIEETVRKIIKSKLDDGQLNECDLTLKELEIVSITILETLKGIFHSRIEYPDDKDIEENKKGAKLG